MQAYLTIPLRDGQPPRRVAQGDFARLFAEDDVQDDPAIMSPAPIRRLAALVKNAMAPLAEITALLRDEHRARQIETRDARITRPWDRRPAPSPR